MNNLNTILNIGAALGLILTTSCKDDNDVNPVEGTPGNTSAICENVSIDEITSTLGISGFYANDPVSGADMTECYYQGEGYSWVSFVYDFNISRHTFDALRGTDSLVFAIINVAGIGDAAYLYTEPASNISGDTLDVNILKVCKGSTRLTISTKNLTTPDKVKQLAVLVISRL
ncbi:MAG: hypothetical protein JW913_04670 [Chitinispirillaceae bacterium]|nr:hypothetical protein [Chitinispirillaceae bacterium]